MAIFHASVTMVSRGAGKSLAQKVAYIGGEKIYDACCGNTRRFSRDDVVFLQVILPKNAPSEYANLQTLVTEIDRSEKRCDAQTARELVLALPIELAAEDRKDFVCKCIEDFWVSRGMCAIIAIHDAGTGNPHAHVLLTTRNVDQNGFSAKKNRDWNSRKLYQTWREFYADQQNLKLKENGLDIQVSHESNFVRGISEQPTHYLGPTANALRKKGVFTERAAENEKIEEERRQKRLQREERRQKERDRSRGRSRS